MDTIVIENKVNLDRLLSTNPEFAGKFQRIIGDALKKARNNTVSAIPIKNDTRRARQAVRNITYKKLLGGNLNILPKRKTAQLQAAKPAVRGRTSRTEQILGYYAGDRGFILRFQNEGTGDRTTANMNGHEIRRGSIAERPRNRKYKTSVIGGRGSLVGKRFFNRISTAKIEAAIEEAMPKIDKLIIELYNKA